VQNTKISWVDGVPVSSMFDDPYFSANDGLAETRHVFLAGNALPERFCDGFHIGETGFGTGLNLLAAWVLWVQSGQTSALKFTSFEAYPLSPENMGKALSKWPELNLYAKRFLAALQPDYSVDLPDLKFQMILGDAAQTLPRWQTRVDAWFLDGFSPGKNPDMWSAELMRQIGLHSRKSATFATYTAAGHVRRNLAAAGFEVSRIKGHGKKRHMTVGKLRDAE